MYLRNDKQESYQIDPVGNLSRYFTGVEWDMRDPPTYDRVAPWSAPSTAKTKQVTSDPDQAGPFLGRSTRENHDMT